MPASLRATFDTRQVGLLMDIDGCERYADGLVPGEFEGMTFWLWTCLWQKEHEKLRKVKRCSRCILLQKLPTLKSNHLPCFVLMDWNWKPTSFDVEISLFFATKWNRTISSNNSRWWQPDKVLKCCVSCCQRAQRRGFGTAGSTCPPQTKGLRILDLLEYDLKSFRWPMFRH